MLRLFLDGRRILALAAAFFALAISAPAWALTTGTLKVSVVDDTEVPLKGVSLELSGDTLIGGKQQKNTDANGGASFVELPPGTYKLIVELAGYKGMTFEGIEININRTALQNVTMQEGSTETVTVVAKQVIDTENTTSGVVLDKSFLEHIPAGRSYQEAVATVPGVQAGSGGNPNMAGAGAAENTYMLDGANITDPVTGTFSLNFNFDAIQQIEVLLGSYMPEYGTSTGGIINIVTQNGTNNLQFQSAVYYENGTWAPKTDERLAADGVQIAPTGFDSQFELINISSLLSGPLIRDKAWFLLSYNLDRTLIANTGIPQARDYEGHYLLSKLLFQPTPEHRFTLLFQTDPTTVDNIDQSTVFQKAEAQGRQAQGGFVSSGRWQWFLSPELNLDTQLTIQKSFVEQGPVPCTHDRSTDRSPCKAGKIEGSIDWETPGRVGVNGAYNSINWGQYYFDRRWTYDASTKLSVLSVKDKTGGSHDLKFGLEGKQQVWDQIQGYSGDTLYVDINNVSFDPNTFQSYYWLEITGPIKFRTTAAAYNMFAQDSWKPVSKLTINYGTRFDSFIDRDDTGQPVLKGALLGPRLFAAWDPFGNQKTKIATGWGRFNDTGNLGIAAFTGKANFGSKLYVGEFFNGRIGDAGYTGFLNNQSYVYSLAPKDNLAVSADDLRAPRVDEVMLDIERQIIPDVAVYTNLSAKFTRFLYNYDDRNLIWDSDGSATIGSRFNDYLQLYPRLRTPELSKRDYYRWDLGVRKVESRRWAASVNYSYTHSVGSASDALDGSFAIDPQTQYNYGPLDTDRTNVVQAQAYWDLPTDPWTQKISAFLFYTDGLPEERLYPNDAVGISGYSVRISPRGTYVRFNPEWYLSLKFEQDIDVRKGQLQLSAQAQNVFNNQSPEIDNGGSIDVSNRLITLFRQSPLQLQLGVGYKF